MTPLHHNWTVRPVAGPVPANVAAAGRIPATVPGTVHTDLLAAGLIEDPYLDDNERLLAWIGLADWRYESTFDWTPSGERVELVFLGLDTVATVELNGVVLAATRNMHRTYRFDVTDVLRQGANTLAVTFASAVRHADRASLELGARPHVNHHPYNAIRKAACNFGWDWGPDLVTCGIWRPVSLQTWSTARLDAVRPVVSVDGARGIVDVHVSVSACDRDVHVTASVAGASGSVTIPPGQTDAVVRVEVDAVERWWPRGHGGQRLYDLEVTLTADERSLDHWAGRIGFRSLRVESTEDADGTSFAFVVNDRPVYVKGVNWIPDDVFPHRVDRQRNAARLAQAEEAGVNLLRVWGGGVFESDDFYAECDERGLMVWQDFLFACAAYAEEPPLADEVEAEARDNVTRLMAHPSLALWNGGNENLWGFADWGWESRLDGRTWGLGYYEELLPSIVAQLDPGRPYIPGSPYSPGADRHPNDPAHGPMHIWDVWNQLDYTAYRGHRPRFVAEFGWQGPPTWSTLRRALSDDPLTPESPGLLVHQKAAAGNDKLVGGLVPHLPVPDDMDDWHWAMSLNQARAIRLGVEHLRALSPVCAGAIVWQLNDCWPVVSWAAVDGDGRRKPMFYALRAAFADRLVTVQPGADGLRVVLVNDTDSPWAGPLSVGRCNYEGKALAGVEVAVDVAPRSTSALPVPVEVGTPANAATELIVAQFGDDRALWFFAEDRDSALPAPALHAEARRSATGYEVTVTATALVKDLALLVDKLDPDAVVNDMLVTLLPGESITFDVASLRDLAPEELLAPAVLRSANQLLRG